MPAGSDCCLRHGAYGSSNNAITLALSGATATSVGGGQCADAWYGNGQRDQYQL
jgi:hypothetical protein